MLEIYRPSGSVASSARGLGAVSVGALASRRAGTQVDFGHYGPALWRVTSGAVAGYVGGMSAHTKAVAAGIAGGGRVELSALAPDVFRLRRCAGRAFSQRESWAVVKADWPAFAVRTEAAPGRLRVVTDAGVLEFDLTSGAWNLRDAEGRVRLAAGPGVTRFHESRPQTAVTLAAGESLHGLGETTGPFNKRGLIREFWNTDVLGHAPAIHPGMRSLYVSIPFALSLREGRAAGLFWDNPARQTWDLGLTVRDQWQLQAGGGELDLYLFIGATPADVVGRYTELTGRMPLPPRWALGYQQCRYSYTTRARVEEIAAELRRRELPCDVLYLDIHHLDEYRVFTFGKDFPEPAELLAKLAAAGFKVVVIVDPGVKDDPKFGVLRRGRADGAFVRAPAGGKDYVGKVWPGAARFPDFLRARTREWWGREQGALSELGVAGFWNDMNEPADFEGPGKTLPLDCRHRSDHGLVRQAEGHNVYGMQMARASRAGALAARPDERPFVITRAGYAGVQRYALVWTGDNSSVWEHLADAIQMLLNLGLSGVAFCGGDAGGFLDHATPELFARWFQFAAFTPFFRNHTNIDTVAQEPWAFGPEVEAICREYLHWRYRLLPYLYGLFVAAHRSGAPIMRPLAWHYPADPVAVAAGDQFLLGPDLLVAPVIRPGATARAVYLPAGTWWDFWTDEAHAGGRHVLAHAPLERLPLYVRGGAVIPWGPVRQFVGQEPDAVTELHVWPAGDGLWCAYEDDGRSLGYERGEFAEREIRHTQGAGRAKLSLGPRRGNFRPAVKSWRLVLRAVTEPKEVRRGGVALPGRWDATARTHTVEFPSSATAFELTW